MTQKSEATTTNTIIEAVKERRAGLAITVVEPDGHVCAVWPSAGERRADIIRRAVRCGYTITKGEKP